MEGTPSQRSNPVQYRRANAPLGISQYGRDCSGIWVARSSRPGISGALQTYDPHLSFMEAGRTMMYVLTAVNRRQESCTCMSPLRNWLLAIVFVQKLKLIAMASLPRSTLRKNSRMPGLPNLQSEPDKSGVGALNIEPARSHRSLRDKQQGKRGCYLRSCIRTLGLPFASATQTVPGTLKNN